jgi:CubicO group peptidase (beta-lactamase class C family)
MPPDVFRAYGDRIGVMHLTTTPEPQPFPLFATAEEAAVSVPGGGGRGPMRELVCLYELLLGRGARGDVRLLSPVAVEAMTARQRVGLVDETYNIVVDWSLGLAVDLISYGRHCSPRTFGHGGMLSSVAFCDPEAGLAAAMVFNGLPTNDAHYLRLEAASTALYEDLGLADGPGRDHALPAVTLG